MLIPWSGLEGVTNYGIILSQYDWIIEYDPVFPFRDTDKEVCRRMGDHFRILFRKLPDLLG